MKKVNLFICLLVLASVGALMMLNGCGSAASSGGGGGGGGGASAPAVHTIYSSSDAQSTMLGLAVATKEVYVAFATDKSIDTSNRYILFYKSTTEAFDIKLVTKEAKLLDTNDRGCIRADITSGNVVYIAYRQYDLANRHIGICSIDGVAGTSFTSFLAHGGAQYQVGCMDVCKDGTGVFIPITYDGSPTTEVKYTDEPGVANGFIQDPLTGTLTDGATAGTVVSVTNTWEAIYVNDFPGATATSEVIFARTDDSSTWHTSLVATSAASENKDVDIFAKNKDTIVSYYRGGNLYVRCSTDEGLSWAAETLVSDAYDDMTSVSISVTGSGHGNVVFTRNGGKDICIARSSDGGASWSVSTLVSLTESGQKFPEMKVSGDHLAIVYRTNQGVFLLRSTNDGSTWD